MRLPQGLFARYGILDASLVGRVEIVAAEVADPGLPAMAATVHIERIPAAAAGHVRVGYEKGRLHPLDASGL
ncbi:hypothetical protein [Nocardia anaemiae]|uniref:hypothetical protein n=1 Tax=Nocardia anaemiae TaxID=263910 RepID=UPI0007A4338F|nr:hypothetical protein [Nocardia anaemiae]